MPAKLESRLPEIAAAIPIKVGEAIRQGAENIARDAAARAPVAPDVAHGLPPGTLRDSIEARSSEGVGQVYGIYSAWYWHFPEYGTRYFAAEPFMVPAAEAGIPELLSNVKAALEL